VCVCENLLFLSFFPFFLARGDNAAVKLLFKAKFVCACVCLCVFVCV